MYLSGFKRALMCEYVCFKNEKIPNKIDNLFNLKILISTIAMEESFVPIKRGGFSVYLHHDFYHLKGMIHVQ